MYRKRVLLVSGLVLLSLIVVGLVLLVLKPQSKPGIIPATVQKQISFVLYLPPSDWQTSAGSVSYHSGVLQLTTSKGSARLSISEQATPPVFNDVPQYYPTLLDKLNQYNNFGTVNGTVYLTKPKELTGQQQAVLNNDGTLLFVHPSHDLSMDDWRRFFNDLQILKP